MTDGGSDSTQPEPSAILPVPTSDDEDIVGKKRSHLQRLKPEVMRAAISLKESLLFMSDDNVSFQIISQIFLI